MVAHDTHTIVNVLSDITCMACCTTYRLKQDITTKINNKRVVRCTSFSLHLFGSVLFLLEPLLSEKTVRGGFVMKTRHQHSATRATQWATQRNSACKFLARTFPRVKLYTVRILLHIPKTHTHTHTVSYTVSCFPNVPSQQCPGCSFLCVCVYFAFPFFFVWAHIFSRSNGPGRGFHVYSYEFIAKGFRGLRSLRMLFFFLL